MVNKLLNYFKRIMPITKEEADAIAATMVIKNYKRGKISVEAYFVLEGYVRQYFMVDGEEKTTNFFTEENA
jgi:hypothetical protein